MNITLDEKIDEKLSLSHLILCRMDENNIDMQKLIAKVQQNSYTSHLSDYVIKRIVYGVTKPDMDVLHVIMEIVGIDYVEIESLYRLRRYYLRLSAGEEEKDIGKPPS